MTQRDYLITRDINGNIRFPSDVVLTTEAVKALIESLYMTTQKDVGIHQLDKSFPDYDESVGIKTKGVKKKWTDEEEKYVLMHHEEGDEEVAEALGRSNMSIFMHKSQLLSDFDAFKNGNEDIKGKTREQVVDMFFGDEEDDEKL